MPTRMRIEYVAPLSVGKYVFARALEDSTFTLTACLRLGGVPIEHWLSQPRMLKKDGSPDLEVFAFFLKSGDDRAKLLVGSEVALEEEPIQSTTDNDGVRPVVSDRNQRAKK